MTMPDHDFSFGALLKAFRKRQRLTQQALAEAIGVHRGTLIRWEQGDYLPESKAMVLELARHLRLDDQQTRQFLEASLTALSPYWSVPLRRNLFFTGREEILEMLHAQLGVDRAVALTQSSALHGLGGVGKTQIALEYVYRHALEYSAIFWIGAETQEQIVSSLLRVASVLQLSERDDKDQQRVITAVHQWLSTHSQWLLIWDNLEDLTLLDRFLPSTRSGVMLLTTRCQALGTLAWGIDLRPMEQEEGMLFLLRRAKVLSPDATGEDVRRMAESKPTEYTVAWELVTALGGLPLALDQAGAYMEEAGCNLASYLHRYQQQRARLLARRGGLGRDHPQSVTTTFSLSMERLEQEQCTAANLLRVCALLHTEAIPEELFHEGAVHLGSELEPLALDPSLLDQAITALRHLSLVQRQPETCMLSLHRLVQVVVRERMSEHEQIMWIRRLGAALAAIFPRVTPQMWGQCERLLPHVLTLAMAMPDQAGTRELAQVFRKAADYLRDRVQYEQAEPLYQRALGILESEQGSDHRGELAAVLNNLAILYFARGQYERAEPLCQRSLHILEQLFGSEHPDVARPLSNLALIYKAQGKYEQAELVYRRLLPIQEWAYGPEHPELARLVYNLALLYSEQGKDEQAEPFHQRSLRILEQVLGSEHPDVAYPLYGLATLYLKQRQYERAEPLYQRSLCIREQALGPAHPLVAHPLHGLAILSLEQNRYAEAESLLQHALSIREQHLGPDHPDTAHTLHDLATLRKTQGNLSEAISFAERALQIHVQVLGEVHPKTVATRTLYAQLVQEQAAGAEKTAAEQERETMAGACNEAYQIGRASLPLHEEDALVSSARAPLQAFLEACCDLHPRAWCRSADLWRAYQHWVEQHQERYPLSRRALSVQLKAHGCRADRLPTARIWRGIALIKQER